MGQIVSLSSKPPFHRAQLRAECSQRLPTKRLHREPRSHTRRERACDRWYALLTEAEGREFNQFLTDAEDIEPSLIPTSGSAAAAPFGSPARGRPEHQVLRVPEPEQADAFASVRPHCIPSSGNLCGTGGAKATPPALDLAKQFNRTKYEFQFHSKGKAVRTPSRAIVPSLQSSIFVP